VTAIVTDVLIFVVIEFIQRDEFPEHLVRELELLRQQEANELLQRELERNTCKVLSWLSLLLLASSCIRLPDDSQEILSFIRELLFPSRLHR